MKDIEDEIPFAVPEGWAWCRLGEIINIKSGDAIKVRENQSGKYPIYGGNGITGYYSEFNIDIPTMIIGRVGFNCGTIHITKGKAWITDNAFITTFNTAYCDLTFLSFALQFLNLSNYSNSTAQPVISGKSIYPIFLALPPLTEQHRIVTAIEAIFTQIDLMEQNKADLQTAVKQVKSKILDLAIHGKLVPQDPADEPASVMLEKLRAEKDAKIASGEVKRGKNDSYIYRKPTDNCYYEKFDGKSDVCIDNEIPFDAPNGWMWCRLKNISSEILYGVNESARQSGSYRLLRITDIQNNYVNWEKVPFADYSENKVEQYLLRNNDIVFARTGATVGKSYLIENLNKAAIHASYLIRIRIFDNLNPKYIKYFFRSLTYWKQITDKTFGIGQPNVNGTSLGRVFISIPPITEQKRIVARIEEIFNALDDIQSNLV